MNLSAAAKSKFKEQQIAFEHKQIETGTSIADFTRNLVFLKSHFTTGHRNLVH